MKKNFYLTTLSLALVFCATVSSVNAQIYYEDLNDVVLDSSAGSPIVYLIPTDHDNTNYNVPITFGGNSSAGIIMFAGSLSDGMLKNGYTTSGGGVKWEYPKTASKGDCKAAGDSVYTSGIYANDGLGGNTDYISFLLLYNSTINTSFLQDPRLTRDSTDKYIFLKMVSRRTTDTTVHYGWVHVSVQKDSANETGDKVIIHDWAYNQTPNAPICAGEGSGCPVAINANGEGGDSVYVDSTIQLLSGSQIDSTVSWSVSDSTLATVSMYGMLTGVAEGTVTIYAERTGDTSCADLYDTISVEVKTAPVIGIVEDQMKTDFSLYPNPGKDFVDVKGEGIRRIEIYNIIGEQVMVQSLQNKEAIRLNLADLERGMYIVRVTNRTGSATKKLLLN